MKKRILLILLLTQLIAYSYAGNEDNKLFTMFPVPLKSSILTIRPTSTFTSITSVELRTLIGKKLQEKTMIAGSDVIFQDMDIYPNGLYVIVVKDANGKILETSKFIINKQ